MPKKPDDDDRPLSPDEIRERLASPNLKIVPAAQDACVALEPYLRQVLTGIAEVTGIRGAFVTDESYLSDFLCSFDLPSAREDYEALERVLGIPIPDNMALVELAAQLKAKSLLTCS